MRVEVTKILLTLSQFDQRANSVVREPELQKFWATERIYERLYEEAKVANHSRGCEVAWG